MEEFLPDRNDARYGATLEELIIIEFELAWRQYADSNDVARPPTIESYLDRFPELQEGEVIRRLVEEEFRARHAAGDRPELSEYQQRFPHFEPSDSVLAANQSTNDLAAGETRLRQLRSTGTRDLARDELPRTFGRFELIERLGMGGMGVVYRARQTDVQRMVAVKVIRGDRLGESSGYVDHRFRVEMLAAARLQHEHIVALYDVGEVDGSAYFSMQFVEGRTLGDLVGEDGSMDGRRAAAYLEPVSRAVHAAHRRGILHRDLKPHNVIVEAETDRPLVADFGLAKLVDDEQQRTRDGDMLGTPAFMAPEQVVDPAAVGPETDVYSLGATLYHLLAGRPPFAGATSLETLRMVIENEPVPPSHRKPSIDRDIETICLRCLRKEPRERYRSAEELGWDLSRYLAGEPIAARPIGRIERLRKWTRRHPWTAIAGTVAIVSLCVALAATTIGYVRVSSALQDAEASHRRSRETVDEFYTIVSEDVLLNQPGLRPLRRQLLERALAHFERFAAERADDRNLQREVALAHYRIGRIAEELESPERALAAYDRAIDLQRGIVARPVDGDVAGELGTTLNARGSALVALSRFVEANQAFDEARNLRERLALESPNNIEPHRRLFNTIMNIGLLRAEEGDVDAAIRELTNSHERRGALLRVHDDDPRLRRDQAMCSYNMANVEVTLGRFEAAEARTRTAIEDFSRLSQSAPGDQALAYRLALSHRLLAEIALVLEHGDDARAALAECEQLLRRLRAENPRVDVYAADLGAALLLRGSLVLGEERPGDAIPILEESVGLIDPVAAGDPGTLRYHRDAATGRIELARASFHLDLESVARERLVEAVRILEPLVSSPSATEELRRKLGEAREMLRFLDDSSDPNE